MPDTFSIATCLSCLLSLLTVIPTSLDAAAPLTWVDSQRDIPRTDGRSVVVSEDGRSLYMTGRGWLMASARDPETGDLTFLRAYLVDDPGIEGLLDPYQVLVSPDGEQVYVSSPGSFIDGLRGSPGILIFDRHEDGTLSFREVVSEGLPDDNSARRIAIAMSADGRHLYATGAGSKGIVHYTRDVTGALQTRQSYAAVGRVEWIAISPDGRHLYTQRSELSPPGLRTYRRDPVSGELELVSHQASFEDQGEDFESLYQLAISSDGKHVYSVACLTCQGISNREPQLVIFTRDADTGGLTLSDVLSKDELSADTDTLLLSPDGRFLYASQVNGTGVNSQISVFARDAASGALQRVGALAQERLPFPTAHPLAISPDGEQLYAGAFEGLAVARLTRDDATGNLDPLGDDAPERGGLHGFGSPRDLAVSADERFVYTLSRDPEMLSALDLTDPGRHEPSSFFYGGWNADVDVSDGKRLVTTDDGLHVFTLTDGEIQSFSRDPVSGELTFRAAHASGTVGYGLSLSPAGRYLLATTHFGSLREASQGFMLFERNSGQGSLTRIPVAFDFIADHDLYLSGNDLDFSPMDGAFVYVPVETVTTRAVAGLAILRFDPRANSPEDRLTLVATQLDFEPHAPPHLRTVISWTGDHLYLLSAEAKTLRAYRRNRQDGTLEPIATYVDGEDGVNGLADPRDLVLHPRGRWLFVADRSSHAVTIFARDPATGLLTPHSVLRHGEDGVDGLLAPSSLAMPLDGRQLFVASETHGTLTTLTTECVESSHVLCLNDGRFRVEARWRDFGGQTGDGIVVPARSDDSGMFWFFDQDNWEMLIKVLDGCSINEHFWLFSAATTNVEYTLDVIDTRTGLTRRYDNPLGREAPATTDIQAFASCVAPGSQDGSVR